MPARFGAAGPLREGLYRPARLRHQFVALAVDGAHAVGRGSAVRLDPERGLAPVIADALGMDSLQVAGAALPRDGGSRVVLKMCRHGKTIAFVKVDVEREPLEHERRVLEELERIGPKSFSAPRVLASLEWHGFTVLVLEPLPLSGRSDRVLAEPEVAALEELSQLRDDLAQALRLSHDLVPAHGDFAPWNSGRTRSGRLALWDWERAYGGVPLEDFFHWHVQRIVLLSAETVDDLVTRTLSPDRDMQALCARLSVPYGEAPLLLRSYLERSAVPLSPTSKGALVRVRAIELLDRAAS